MTRKTCLSIFLTGLFALIPPLPGYSQPRIPSDPKTPEVNLRTTGPERRYAYAATVDLHGMKSLKGKVLFPDDKLIIPLPEGGERKTFVVQVASIRSIEFLEWQWRENRKRSFLFSPSKVRINLERSYYISDRNIGGLDRLRFIDASAGDKERAIYSVFYDYREKGRWTNLKSEVTDGPVTKPFRGTVTKIEFHREVQDFPDFFNIFRGNQKK